MSEYYIHIPEVDTHYQELQEKWLDRNLSSDKPQVHVYSNINSENIRFEELFGQLFKPNKKLQEALDYHYSLLTKDYVSISFRFTTLFGDFTDCFNNILSPNEKEKLIMKSIKVIEQLEEKIEPNQKIFVTSDSCTFIERISHLPRVYVAPGKIGHIAHQSSDEINMKTFVDFLLISTAKKVYVGISTGMFNSDFCKTAALIHKVPFEIIKY